MLRTDTLAGVHLRAAGSIELSLVGCPGAEPVNTVGLLNNSSRSSHGNSWAGSFFPRLCQALSAFLRVHSTAVTGGSCCVVSDFSSYRIIKRMKYTCLFNAMVHAFLFPSIFKEFSNRKFIDESLRFSMMKGHVYTGVESGGTARSRGTIPGG